MVGYFFPSISKVQNFSTDFLDFSQKHKSSPYKTILYDPDLVNWLIVSWFDMLLKLQE